jgi:hypothetical protein
LKKKAYTYITLILQIKSEEHRSCSSHWDNERIVRLSKCYDANLLGNMAQAEQKVYLKYLQTYRREELKYTTFTNKRTREIRKWENLWMEEETRDNN